MGQSGGKRPTLRRRPSYFFGYSPIRAVRVSGHSMSPTLNWGDWVLFRKFQLPASFATSAGAESSKRRLDHQIEQLEKASVKLENKLLQKIVLIARLGPDGQRDLMQIKRVVKVELIDSIPNESTESGKPTPSEIGIWVEGDNASQSSDSRHWGHISPDEIIGIYLTRYHLG